MEDKRNGNFLHILINQPRDSAPGAKKQNSMEELHIPDTHNPMSPYYDEKNDPDPVFINCPRCGEHIELDTSDVIKQKQWHETIMTCPECGDIYRSENFEDIPDDSDQRKLIQWFRDTPF